MGQRQSTGAMLPPNVSSSKQPDKGFRGTLTGQIPRPILGRLDLEMKTTARCKHLTPMERNQNSSKVEGMDLSALESQVDELIQTCDLLTDENRALRDQQSTLVAERASLIEKSELARSRVEAMIARLKAMEIGT